MQVSDSFFLQKPWDHQLKVFNEAKDLTEYALFFDMGTGKTFSLINLLRYKYIRHKGLLKTLILCPLIVTENWANEFRKYSKIDSKSIAVLTGPGKERAKLLRDGKAKIFITNYEALIMPDVYVALQAWGPEVIVLDESHRCKDGTAQRTKRALELSADTMYRYLLSGTPVLNNALDLFYQFKIMDRGATFGANFTVFRGTYFYDRNARMPAHRHFPDWRIRPGALDAINKMIKSKSMSIKKSECLDLPPLVKQRIEIELSPSQRKLYDEMKSDFITFMAGKAVTAQLAITKALRLLQITSGFVKTAKEEGGEEISIKDNPRAQALKDLLQEIAPYHKVLVWAVFKENYQAISKVCEALDLKHVFVHGEQNYGEKMEAVASIQNDPDCRVLIGNPGAGGIGINLTAASYSIFYSRGFSLEHDLQAEARNHRGGSEIHESVTRIDLIAKETIDELILARLSQKQAIGERVLRELVEELNAPGRTEYLASGTFGA